MEVPDNTYKWFILQQKKKISFYSKTSIRSPQNTYLLFTQKTKKLVSFFSYIEGDHTIPKILRIFFKILTGQDLTIKFISHFVSHASLNEVTKS